MTVATRPARPSGWYYGWNIVTICILSQVASNGLTYNAFSLFLDSWSAQLHTPVSQLQLAVGALTLVAAVITPFVGALADKYSARKLFACGLLGIGAFYFAIGAATASWQITLLYGILGAPALCLSTAVTANAVISRWFVHRRGLALGLSSFGVGMGGVILPPIVAAALPVIGWRMIWRIGGFVLILLVMPLVAFVIRNRPTTREGFHYIRNGDANSHIDGHTPGGTQLGYREVFSRKNFWIIIAVYLPMMLLYGGCAQNIAPYATAHGLREETAGILLSALSLSHLAGTLLFGLISDRFGNRLPFAGLAAIMAVGGLLLAFSATLPLIGLGCVLIGFGGGFYTLLAAALAVEFGSQAFGRAYGLSLIFIPLAPIAAFAVAKTEESTGSYMPSFLALAVLVLIGGAVSLLLNERRRARGLAIETPV